MLLDGGGLNVPALSRLSKLTVKIQQFFDILKAYNELGKVKKSETSRTIFSWRDECSKNVRAKSALLSH